MTKYRPKIDRWETIDRKEPGRWVTDRHTREIGIMGTGKLRIERAVETEEAAVTELQRSTVQAELLGNASVELKTELLQHKTVMG